MVDSSIGGFLVALVVTVVFFALQSDVPETLGVQLDPVLGELLALVVALACTFLLFAGYHRVRSTM